MILVDRIGAASLGLLALIWIAGHAYFSQLASDRIARQAEEQEKIAAMCTSLPANSIFKDLMCSPSLPEKNDIPTFVAEAPFFFNAAAYVLLPFWLLLRLIDFVCGGPARRVDTKRAARDDGAEQYPRKL
jgi:hypothetical protein